MSNFFHCTGFYLSELDVLHSAHWCKFQKGVIVFTKQQTVNVFYSIAGASYLKITLNGKDEQFFYGSCLQVILHVKDNDVLHFYYSSAPLESIINILVTKIDLQ
jgi:hypothetical protein